MDVEADGEDASSGRDGRAGGQRFQRVYAQALGKAWRASMTGDRPFWDAAYRDPEAETFGPASKEIVELAAALPSGARALDIGCGDGRNALYLAQHDRSGASW